MTALSDNTKWYFQIGPIYLTLAIVAYRIWEKRRGRAQDGVSVNQKRWTAQRMGNMLRNDDNYTEWDMIKLEENSQNRRDAYAMIHQPGTYRCPWGKTCPAVVNGLTNEYIQQANTDDFTPEQHIKYAYNMTKAQIDRHAKLRHTKETDIYAAMDNHAEGRKGSKGSKEDELGRATRDIASMSRSPTEGVLILL